MSDHVIVGMSGGVDSSVAALRLLEAGHRVSGLYMVNWTEDEAAYCSAAEDYRDAQAVCDELGIVLHRVDFSKEYRERVFQRFLADYAAGKTPNPDVLCNREVKFQPFREHALRLGADRIATGHYACVEAHASGAQLLRAADENKDQTYFLALVDSAALAQVEFPLGDLRKSEVRKLAQAAGLPNHRKPDSTGICFIGERPMREFLGRYLTAQPGPILDEQGRTVGTHPGLMSFTLGQRRGLGVGGQAGARDAPWYVVEKDLPSNTLRVSQNPQHPKLYSDRLQTEPFHFLDPKRPLPPLLQARLRHRQALQDCRATLLPDGGLELVFAQPQRAVVAGQFAVLYDGRLCLGGGEIRSSATA